MSENLKTFLFKAISDPHFIPKRGVAQLTPSPAPRHAISSIFSYTSFNCFRILDISIKVSENLKLSLVSNWTFFAICCSFWFFVPTKSHNEHCDAQMETSTKTQNEQQEAITSNKRHLPVLVFEIELILSQKQERTTKRSKRQRTANGDMHQKPKRATKSNKEHF